MAALCQLSAAAPLLTLPLTLSHHRSPNTLPHPVGDRRGVESGVPQAVRRLPPGQAHRRRAPGGGHTQLSRHQRGL